MPANPLRNIPSIHELLENPTLKALAERLHPSAVVSTMRVVLDEVAAEVHTAAAEKALPSVAELAERISRRVLEGRSPVSCAAINATGLLHHPELGSPPWPSPAVEAMVAATNGYAAWRPATPAPRTAEFDNLAAERIREFTGAEEALVLGSAAAAMMATLATLGGRNAMVVARRDVIRRGPDYDVAALAEAVSVQLREVGGANDVHLDDYRRALDGETAAILAARRGDGRAGNHGGSPAISELAHLAREKRLPVIHDLGPAPLVDFAPAGIDLGPRPGQSIEAGADLVIFGHEMLGGPACGIVAGRRNLVERIAGHAIARASRLGRPVLAALAATLESIRSADEARRSTPLVQLLSASGDNLKQRAERLAPQLAACEVVQTAEVVASRGAVVGGVERYGEMASWSVVIQPRGAGGEQLAEALRLGDPAVVGVVEGGRLLLNLRSVLGEQDLDLVAAVEAVDRNLASKQRKGEKHAPAEPA